MTLLMTGFLVFILAQTNFLLKTSLFANKQSSSFVSVSPDIVKCTSVLSKCAADVFTIANICVNKFKNCALAVEIQSHKHINYFFGVENKWLAFTIIFILS